MKESLEKISAFIQKIKSWVAIGSKLLAWVSNCLDTFPDFTQEKKSGEVDS